MTLNVRIFLKLNLGYIQIYGSDELNRNKLKEHLNNLANSLEINFEITLEITK